MHRKIELFGKWNSSTAMCEVKRFDPDDPSEYNGPPPSATIVIERPFSAKEHTLTIDEARQLGEALLELANGPPEVCVIGERRLPTHAADGRKIPMSCSERVQVARKHKEGHS